MSSCAFFLRNINADGFVRDENKGKKYDSKPVYLFSHQYYD